MESLRPIIDMIVSSKNDWRIIESLYEYVITMNYIHQCICAPIIWKYLSMDECENQKEHVIQYVIQKEYDIHSFINSLITCNESKNCSLMNKLNKINKKKRIVVKRTKLFQTRDQNKIFFQ